MAEPATTTSNDVIDPAEDRSAGTAWRPGDLRPDVDAMIRVDQAGEYGATQIYAGQLAVLGTHPFARPIARMQMQEQRHLRQFDEIMTDRAVRPTLLQPLWKLAGHSLGAVTALISPSAAMACTAAVETEIDLHYASQLRVLEDADPALSARISEFQAEEVEHRATALAAGAENAVGYPILTAVIRAGCRLAIRVSKRI